MNEATTRTAIKTSTTVINAPNCELPPAQSPETSRACRLPQTGRRRITTVE
jgi:hypothetical protein